MSTLEIILGVYSLVVSVLVMFIMYGWGETLNGWRKTLDEWGGTIDEWGGTIDGWGGTIDGWQETLDLLEAGEQR